MRKSYLLGILAALCFACGCSDDSSKGSNGDNQGQGTGEQDQNHPEDPSTEKDKPVEKPDRPVDKPVDNPEPPEPQTDPCQDIDLQTSHDHCGTCEHVCGEYEDCVDGACVCQTGYIDCDGDGVCETEGACECKPGETRPCYDGDEGTENVGACHGGHQECQIEEGMSPYWGLDCIDQVLPNYEYTCDPSQPDLDLDCNGKPDATQDSDGDSYTVCNEGGDAILDCCDHINRCGSPELIHPNQIDCRGNYVDDNCSGAADDDPEAPECGDVTVVVEADCKIKDQNCSSVSKWNYGETKNASAWGAYELAKAMDACLDVVTAESNKPGLIEYAITPASDYHIGIDPKQIHIKTAMKDAEGNVLIKPRVGETFVLLSSGIAGDVHDELSKYGIEDMKFSLGGSIPEPYRTAHANQLQTHPACASGGSDIYDSVRLHLKMRAPETAKGISFDFRFFSREYPYYVCSKYNDFFLSILTDENGHPIADLDGDGDVMDEDGNISFDKNNNPVSVNNAFFTTCAEAPCGVEFLNASSDKCPATIACSGDKCGGTMCTDGSDVLSAYYPKPYTGGTDLKEQRGGGTAWLTTKAPVKPGEIFNLDFYIWDTGDLRFDSTVILDNFQWECTETQVGTDFAKGEVN